MCFPAVAHRMDLALFDGIEQGSPTFFLGGPHSDLGHRRRATYQWRSKRRIFKGGRKGCG